MLICLMNVNDKCVISRRIRGLHVEKLYYLTYNYVPVKVRIYAGEACFRGRFGRALLGRVGARLGQSRSSGEPGRTIYM